MPNQVTITISSTDASSVIDRSVDTTPAPLPIDTLRGQADTSGPANAVSFGEAPAPLPLDQLLLGSSLQDSTAPAPSALDYLVSARNGSAPSPLPPDDLQSDGKDRPSR